MIFNEEFDSIVDVSWGDRFPLGAAVGSLDFYAEAVKLLNFGVVKADIWETLPS